MIINGVNKLEIEKLSKTYTVRRLVEEDIEDIYNLCLSNPLYFKHCPPMVTKESIVDDMNALPKSVSIDDKYYIGFYDGCSLIAICDLIMNYPEKDVAFIGLFMVDAKVSGKGIGTKIIVEMIDHFKKIGYKKIRLAWVKSNEQSEHFWLKNGFIVIKESDSVALGQRLVVAEKEL